MTEKFVKCDLIPEGVFSEWKWKVRNHCHSTFYFVLKSWEKVISHIFGYITKLNIPSEIRLYIQEFLWNIYQKLLGLQNSVKININSHYNHCHCPIMFTRYFLKTLKISLNLVYLKAISHSFLVFCIKPLWLQT